MVTVLARSTQVNHASLVEGITPFNEALRVTNQSGLWDLDVLQGLARLESEVTRQATMIGYLNDFWLLTLLAAAVVPLVLLLDRPGGERTEAAEDASSSKA